MWEVVANAVGYLRILPYRKKYCIFLHHVGNHLQDIRNYNVKRKILEHFLYDDFILINFLTVF